MGSAAVQVAMLWWHTHMMKLSMTSSPHQWALLSTCLPWGRLSSRPQRSPDSSGVNGMHARHHALETARKAFKHTRKAKTKHGQSVVPHCCTRACSSHASQEVCVAPAGRPGRGWPGGSHYTWRGSGAKGLGSAAPTVAASSAAPPACALQTAGPWPHPPRCVPSPLPAARGHGAPTMSPPAPTSHL